MFRKVAVLFLTFAILVGLIFTTRFFLGDPEDNWLCVDGEWIKHGNPFEPKPTGTCK